MADELSLVNKFAICIFSFIILVGIIGNTMNMVVFKQKSMKLIITFRLLFFLSIINLFVLIICASDSLLSLGFNFEIRLHSTLMCRLHTFLTYYITHLSSGMLVIVNLERVFVLCKLESFFSCFSRRINQHDVNNQERSSANTLKSFKSFNKIKGSIACMIVLVTLINSHFLFSLNLNTVDIEVQNLERNFSESVLKFTTENLIQNRAEGRFLIKSSQRQDRADETNFQNDYDEMSPSYRKVVFMCYPVDNYKYNYFVSDIWVYIDAAIYSLIPFIVMVVCTILVIKEINKNMNQFIKSQGTRFIHNRHLAQRRRSRNKQIAFLLIISNTYFIFCSIPFYVIYFFYQSETNDAKCSFMHVLVHSLAYSNNSVNFIFYGLFSQKYREELVKIFCCRTTTTVNNRSIRLNRLGCQENNSFNRDRILMATSLQLSYLENRVCARV